MNILWVTNIALPEASVLLKENPIPFGGWLDNSSRELSNIKDINLTVAFPKDGINDLKIVKGKKITYIAFPMVSDKVKTLLNLNKNLEEILNKAQPSIVHIFGTEFSHTLAMVNACELYGVKTVISIQGLVSVISKHYMNGLPQTIQKRFTLRDFLKKNNIEHQQKVFSNRGKFEIEALQKVNYVIGRTTWDKACTTQINPNITYYHCNETLRGEFYNHIWDIEKCEKYSIFLSQGSYPIKGLHFMIEAMSILIKRFPDAKLYIGGNDLTKSDTLKDKLRISSYGKYIKELIQTNNLQNKVEFTGVLNEKEMCERYLKSNVFVCPSTIENSPNSLGEAMLLGVPCVASNVGGIPDLIKHQEEGFTYQHDAPYMMAHYIREIFNNKELCLEFSRNARLHALKTHDKENNTKNLLDIYDDVLG